MARRSLSVWYGRHERNEVLGSMMQMDRKERDTAMYSDKVMDHFNHPRNVGEIENASGVGTVGNAKCGDIMRIYLDIDSEGVIREAKFKTFGCGAAVATSSMATELVKGKTVQEALQVTNKAVMEALDGLPPVKVHCSLLAEEAIHAALWDYAEKNHLVRMTSTSAISRNICNFLAISRLISFSSAPLTPTLPVSAPPCPASMTTRGRFSSVTT